MIMAMCQILNINKIYFQNKQKSILTLFALEHNFRHLFDVFYAFELYQKV